MDLNKSCKKQYTEVDEVTNKVWYLSANVLSQHYKGDTEYSDWLMLCIVS